MDHHEEDQFLYNQQSYNARYEYDLSHDWDKNIEDFS